MRYEYFYSKAKRTICAEAILSLKKVYRITDYFPIHSVDLPPHPSSKQVWIRLQLSLCSFFMSNFNNLLLCCCFNNNKGPLFYTYIYGTELLLCADAPFSTHSFISYLESITLVLIMKMRYYAYFYSKAKTTIYAEAD